MRVGLTNLYAMNNTVLEAKRRYENSIEIECRLTQLLQGCATWKLLNCCLWKAMKKTFKLKLKGL